MEDDYVEINKLLAQLRDQVARLNSGPEPLRQPFFPCWFMSLPQFLVMLDTVDGPESFKDALWTTRNIVTGKSDLYADMAYMRKLRSGAKATS
jgi:hypothetical protein